jgi:hypothetical protein
MIDPRDLAKMETPPSSLIFLDVDGVLNSGDGNNAIGQLVLDGFIPSHQKQRWFQPRHVRLLAKLEHLSGASLILSSSWRLDTHPGEIEHFMREAGHPSPCIVGTTDSGGPTRGAEIGRYLKYFQDNVAFGPVPYVVLDDDWDPDMHPDHFVSIDYQEGLTERHVERAVKILNGP